MTSRDMCEAIVKKVAVLPKGTIFRLRDLTGMPVAGAVGFIFREEVKNRRIRCVRFLGNIDEVNIYEKK